MDQKFQNIFTHITSKNHVLVPSDTPQLKLKIGPYLKNQVLTLEIPANGTVFRVSKRTVEYQIWHDQKLNFLPLEPQQVW